MRSFKVPDMSCGHCTATIEKAIKKREVRYSWFRVYEGSAPDYMLAARHHYKNFFEIPILFYNFY